MGLSSSKILVILILEDDSKDVHDRGRNKVLLTFVRSGFHHKLKINNNLCKTRYVQMLDPISPLNQKPCESSCFCHMGQSLHRTRYVFCETEMLRYAGTTIDTTNLLGSLIMRKICHAKLNYANTKYKVLSVKKIKGKYSWMTYLDALRNRGHIILAQTFAVHLCQGRQFRPERTWHLNI